MLRIALWAEKDGCISFISDRFWDDVKVVNDVVKEAHDIKEVYEKIKERMEGWDVIYNEEKSRIEMIHKFEINLEGLELVKMEKIIVVEDKEIAYDLRDMEEKALKQLEEIGKKKKNGVIIKKDVNGYSELGKVFEGYKEKDKVRFEEVKQKIKEWIKNGQKSHNRIAIAINGLGHILLKEVGFAVEAKKAYWDEVKLI